MLVVHATSSTRWCRGEWLAHWETRLHGLAPVTAGSTTRAPRLACLLSLAQFLKHRVKNAVSYITQFEMRLRRKRPARLDGVICGHIHKAEIRDIGASVLQRRDW